MTTIEIEYLIELAEQSSDPQDIDSGKKAKAELAALRAESEARRVALEQKAEEVIREWTRAENAEAALEEAKARQAQEVDEFNAGFEWEADFDLDDAEQDYRSNMLAKETPFHDVFSTGYAWAKFAFELGDK